MGTVCGAHAGAGQAADVAQEVAAADGLDVGHVVGELQEGRRGGVGVAGEEVGAGEVDAVQEGGAGESTGGAVVGEG